VSALVVALVPWYIANIDVVERSRAVLRIWAGGIHSEHGKYAELLARLGAEVRTYTTEVDGKMYKRYLVIIRSRLCQDVVKTPRNRKKHRKLAKKRFSILVETSMHYSPRLGEELEELRQRLNRYEWRWLAKQRIHGELEDLLESRFVRRLLDSIRVVLARREMMYSGMRFVYTGRWLRELFNKGHGYGFNKRIAVCVDDLMLRYGLPPRGKRLSVDELRSRCAKKIMEEACMKKQISASRRWSRPCHSLLTTTRRSLLG